MEQTTPFSSLVSRFDYVSNFPNPVVQIRGKNIGRGYPTYIIAEIGNNHNGSIDLARREVQAAAHGGADAVKFQKRTVSEVFTKELLDRPQTHSTSLGTTYRQYREAQELKDEELAELKELAHSLGMAFFVTPFDLTSAHALAQIGMDCWKIASFDVDNKPLLEFVAKTGQPIFLSTGMSTIEDIDRAVATILQYNTQLVVKHCVSIYPTPDADLNLGGVRTLTNRYSPLPIGYSGHELGFIPTITAVALGACSVERHFTLDKTLPGPDHSTVSLEPLEFAEMVKQIRRIEAAVADEKIYVHENEKKMKNKHGKSVVSLIDISAGTLITREMLVFKSPGYGVKPTMVHMVVGRAAKADILADTVIEEHLLA